MRHASFVSLLLVTAVTAACTGADTSPAARTAAADPVPVSTGRARVADVPATFEAGGIVRARFTATIASRVMAPVVAVHVAAGTPVKKGQPLVELDAREMRANLDRAVSSSAAAEQSLVAADAGVAAARAALTLARATHQRLAELAAKKSATAQELDQAVAGLAGAEAQLRSAEAQRAAAQAGRDAAGAAGTAASTALSYTQLTAPFDGVVSQRLLDPGTMATPGAPILVLEDPASFRVDAVLDESRAAQVQVGAAVEVSVDASAEAPAWRSSRVTEIARVDPASHAFLVKVDLPDGVSARAGAFARIRVAGPARKGLVAPASTIVRRGQLAFVYVVDKDLAHLRAVSTAAGHGSDVELLAGVAEGEALVDAPPPTLTDGRRVQVSASGAGAVR